MSASGTPAQANPRYWIALASASELAILGGHNVVLGGGVSLRVRSLNLACLAPEGVKMMDKGGSGRWKPVGRRWRSGPLPGS